MMEEEKRRRVVGDYILEKRIGSGSFAIVWRSRHRSLGHQVAIKEIDKKRLFINTNPCSSPPPPYPSKITQCLQKEISILSNIHHPNIIRLHQTFQTADKIFLVLEYCVGGDLADYIQRFGRVSESVARHFMRQLASGLQVLRENNLIHRDLKPQNLLLSSKDTTPTLKIGDFGFARYLTPQGLADTLCGSPLYMAPEIIQNQKYDAKADLWSVGAILFQLITGRPPFNGNSQYQLFQNILKSSELQFPQNIVKELHADCIDLCRSLLRHNPVERLTFEEFFNHKFMADPRPSVGVGPSSLPLESRAPAKQAVVLTDVNLPLSYEKRQPLQLGDLHHSSGKSSLLITSDDNNILAPKNESAGKDREKAKTYGATRSHNEAMLESTDGNLRKSTDCGKSNLSDQGATSRGVSSKNPIKGADSLELIEREYVLVNSNFASMDTLCSSLDACFRDSSEAGLSNHLRRVTGKFATVQKQIESSSSAVCGVESLGSHGSVSLTASQTLPVSVDVRRPLSIHPLMRLRSLYQYVLALSEIAQEKLNAELPLESFSVELVALAVWKEALRVSSSWAANTVKGTSIGESSAGVYPPSQEDSCLSFNLPEGVDFNSPASVCSWVEQEFIVAFDQAEKMSTYLHNMDGGAEMPDAMEIIFQTALLAGRAGAVEELMGYQTNAAALYSKARILLLFVVQEAPLLPLNPPFTLSVSDQQRIHSYITSLKSHQSQSKMHSSYPNQESTTK